MICCSLHVVHLITYPAPPGVTFKLFFILDFPLMHTGQSVFPHSSVYAGDFLHMIALIGTPPCSTILGFTWSLLCSAISVAIFLHDKARAPFGVAGQNTGNMLYTSPPPGSSSRHTMSSSFCLSLFFFPLFSSF